MNSKERIDAVVRGLEIDRVPVSVWDGGLWLCAQNGYSFKDLYEMEDAGASLLVDFFKKTGTDLPFIGVGLVGIMYEAIGCSSRLDVVGAPAEYGVRLGSLSEISALKKEDIRQQLETDYYVQRVFKQLELVKKEIGDTTYIGANIGGPFTACSRIVCLQSLLEAIAEEDEELPALYDYAVTLVSEYANLLANHGVDVISVCDPVASGSMIGLEMYENVALPMEKAVLERVNATYKLMHICGDTLTRIPLVKDLPLDIFSLDIVDIPVALEAAENQLVIMGNLSPLSVMCEMDAEHVGLVAQELCARMGKGSKFILAPGCDLPPSVSEENIMALMRAPLCD